MADGKLLSPKDEIGIAEMARQLASIRRELDTLRKQRQRGMMMPPVSVARITVVNGSGQASTYDAESIRGPTMAVAAAIPIDRDGGVEFVPKIVTDTCLLIRIDEAIVYMIGFEKPAWDDCP